MALRIEEFVCFGGAGRPSLAHALWGRFIDSEFGTEKGSHSVINTVQRRAAPLPEPERPVGTSLSQLGGEKSNLQLATQAVAMETPPLSGSQV